MQCKQCAYTLWHLKPGPCPECGRRFSPAEFEFVVGSVQYLCPHCGQDYYGTDTHGHLEPRAFDCVRCGSPIAMHEMACIPTAGVEESRTAQDAMPWRRRANVGFFKAWLKTVWMSLGTPRRLMRADSPPSLPGAWGFFALTILTYSIFQIGASVAMMALMFLSAGPGGPRWGPMMVLPMIAAFIVAAFAATTVLLVIWSLLAHGILRLGGRVEHGYTGTLGALLYSSGASILGCVPCLFFYSWPLALPWWTVSATLMVYERQHVGGWRAAVAVVTPPVLFLAGAIGLIAWAMATAVTAATTFSSAAAPNIGVQPTRVVTAAMLDYANETGQAPQHVLELVLDGDVQSAQLVLAWTTTQPWNIPVGDTTLLNVQNASQAEQQQAMGAVTPPAGVIAYRFGDMVFTYPGIDLIHADPALWLVITSPNPASGAQPIYQYVAGLADGTATTIPPDGFAVALKAQNLIRAQYGLAPLPEPATVTHDKPAIAE